MNALSRMRHLLSAPWRLAAAMRRHGPANVVSFGLEVLRRRGPTGTLIYALSSREARREQASVAEAAAALPPRLQMIQPRVHPTRSVWRDWLARTMPLPAADPIDEAFTPIHLVVAVRGEAREGMEATRAAVAALFGPALAGPVLILDTDDPAAWAEVRRNCEAVILFIEAGDRVAPEAPIFLARAAHRGAWDVLSFDLAAEVDDAVAPIFLPGANRTLAGEVDYLFSRLAVRAGALPAETPPARLVVYEWLKRWIADHAATSARGRWRHVARPLVTLAAFPHEPVERGREALLGRRTRQTAPSPSAPPPVSVVICTHNKGFLLRQLVRGLLTDQSHLVAEVAILANNTSNRYALRALEDLNQDPRVTVVRRDEPFNFSRLSNAGAEIVSAGQAVLFLNDDIAPVTEDWLATLMKRLDDPAVAAVGPLLVYPDERVQHAGMYLGYNGCAGHVLRHARLPDDDYLFTAVAAREVSCLTGAAMLVRRTAFAAINGFDDMLATYLQDVDLGLRLGRCGWTNVFEPASILIHMESASIREVGATAAFRQRRAAELEWFNRRWGAQGQGADPLHPAGFDVQDELMRRLRSL